MGNEKRRRAWYPKEVFENLRKMREFEEWKKEGTNRAIEMYKSLDYNSKIGVEESLYPEYQRWISAERKIFRESFPQLPFLGNRILNLFIAHYTKPLPFSYYPLFIQAIDPTTRPSWINWNSKEEVLKRTLAMLASQTKAK